MYIPCLHIATYVSRFSVVNSCFKELLIWLAHVSFRTTLVRLELGFGSSEQHNSNFPCKFVQLNITYRHVGKWNLLSRNVYFTTYFYMELVTANSDENQMESLLLNSLLSSTIWSEIWPKLANVNWISFLVTMREQNFLNKIICGGLATTLLRTSDHIFYFIYFTVTQKQHFCAT